MTLSTLPIAHYEQLLGEKKAYLSQLLRPYSPPKLEIYPSDVQHFRMRAEFRVWHDGDDLYHIMFNQETKQRQRIDTYPQGSLLINQMMKTLIPLLKKNDILRQRLFQIDYLSTQSQQIIVSLLYHKTLNEEWTQQAKALKATLEALGFQLHIIGRASKQKICLDQDYVDEVLTVKGRDYLYRQVENSFTQPNAGVNQKMLEWAVDCTQNSEEDLLELYCGNGNFSVALAQNFRKVLATEVAKPSVEAAQFNIHANQIDNLHIIRMSAEDFTQALNGVRDFYRLRDVDLSTYRCRTIFVDPPRAGLDPDTLKLVQHYERILYISCNPHTLCDNLQTLFQTHRIERAALFDQFPYTHHIETGVWLIKK